MYHNVSLSIVIIIIIITIICVHCYASSSPKIKCLRICGCQVAVKRISPIISRLSLWTAFGHGGFSTSCVVAWLGIRAVTVADNLVWPEIVASVIDILDSNRRNCYQRLHVSRAQSYVTGYLCGASFEKSLGRNSVKWPRSFHSFDQSPFGTNFCWHLLMKNTAQHLWAFTLILF